MEIINFINHSHTHPHTQPCTQFLVLINLTYENWTETRDPSGAFEIKQRGFRTEPGATAR